MENICTDSVSCNMTTFQFAGKERETLIEPMYKKIDKHGRLYISVDLAEQEALILIVKPLPEDKIDYIKVGRT